MSELALTCSVGSTAVHRTVTQSNVQKQYVYGDGTFAVSTPQNPFDETSAAGAGIAGV